MTGVHTCPSFSSAARRACSAACSNCPEREFHGSEVTEHGAVGVRSAADVRLDVPGQGVAGLLELSGRAPRLEHRNQERRHGEARAGGDAFIAGLAAAWDDKVQLATGYGMHPRLLG